MLILLPILILLVTLLVLLMVMQSKKAAGFAWMISLVSAIGVWILLFTLHFRTLESFILSDWYLGEGISSSLVYQLDRYSWIYAFSLSSLLVAVLFVSAARFNYADNLWPWVGSIFLAIGGLLAVMAESALALILAWSIIDLVEFFIIFQTVPNRQQRQATVLSMGARLAGTLLLSWALLDSRSRGQGFTLDQFPPESGVFLLLAAGLRMGVIPMHLPYAKEPGLRRELGTMLRLASPASSLVLLSRLPPAVVTPDLAPYLLIFTALASVYGAYKWLTEKDELNGRPYWIIAIAGFAIGSAIRGRPLASLSWGISLILCGGFIFLFFAKNRVAYAATLFAIGGISGLPFTPAAGGWQGLVVLPFNLLDLVSILSHSMLLAGFIKHSLRPGRPLKELEGWAQGLYIIGLSCLAASQWIIGIIGWEGSLTIGNWWASSISTLLAIGGLGLTRFFKTRRTLGEEGPEPWILLFLKKIDTAVIHLFNLNWVYRLGFLLFKALQRFVRFLTLLLEGEGGILWALVLLALIISLLITGGST